MSYRYRRMYPTEIESYLHEARNAVVGTIKADGRPQLNTVWFLYEEGRIWFSFFNWSNKYVNLFHDGRVCLCIPSAYGDDSKQVIVYGTVKPEDMIKQGTLGYNDALDYRMTQQYHETEELARISDEGDAEDGPWMQISFVPDKIIGDDYGG